MLGEARIGTSGFERLDLAGSGPAVAELVAQYARLLATVEIGSAFQRLPSAESLAAWATLVPTGFQFAVKVPRRISHDLRLSKPTARSLESFLEAIAELGSHLGPVLVQLPSALQLDLKALTDFLAALPSGPRLAFEFRHPSWQVPAVLRALSARGASLVVSDSDEADKRPRIELTADFAYLRLRQESDDREFWIAWAERLAALTRRGVDVYAYVKHDRRVEAVDRARRLAALLRTEVAAEDQPLLT
jgi:uncharacterized protein YecE (DUF72 family)